MVTDSVAVVTGGASSIGLETARQLARDHHIVLADTGGERLTRALDRLDSMGVSAESMAVDLTEAREAELLMRTAHSAGHVAAVVHLSSSSATTDPSPTARALSLVHIAAATLAVAQAGTIFVHASAAPAPAIPRWLGRMAPPGPITMATVLTWLVDRAPNAAQTLSAVLAGWHLADLAPRFAALGARLMSDVPALGEEGAVALGSLLADLHSTVSAA